MPGQIKVQVTPTEIQLNPGGSPATVRVDVFNGGTIVDQFWAGAYQAPEWLTAEPRMVNLFPEQRGTIELVLNVKPGRVVAAGLYPIAVRIVSASTREVVGDQLVQVGVGTVLGALGLTLRPSEVRGVRGASLSVQVAQGGNAPVQVELFGEDTQGVLAFGFEPPTLVLPPAGSATAYCQISARAPFFGDVVPHSFTISAQGLQQPLQATGVFHQSPVFSRRLMRILAISLTSCGAVLATVAAILLPWTGGGGGMYGRALNGLMWDYHHLAQLYYLGTLTMGNGILQSRWLSGGSLVIILSALALGCTLLGKAKLARTASAFVLLIPVALLISITFAAQKVGAASSGAFVAIVGGLLALCGSFFVRPLSRSLKTPKAPKAPKKPTVPKGPAMPKGPGTPQAPRLQ